MISLSRTSEALSHGCRQDLDSRIEYRGWGHSRPSLQPEAMPPRNLTNPDPLYSRTRSMLRRLVLEGTVTQNWLPYADKISKQLNRSWQRIVQNRDL